jgi:transcriptional regulator with XRE-family HTH domain
LRRSLEEAERLNPDELGASLRRLRREAGMGLRELARAAGTSAAALSAVERGASSPTLATLHKVLRALGTDFAGFFGAGAESDSPVFLPRQMRTIADAHRRYTLVFPRRRDIRFQMLIETLSPREQASEWETHECDFGGRVLSGGPARLEIEGMGQWTLRNNFAFYVRAGQRHRALNLGRRPLKLITVWYPPRY